MKREFVAVIILIMLFAGTLCGTAYLTEKTDSLVELVNYSERAASEGDLQKALSIAGDAAKQWSDMNRYTHIFVRHSEVDATADAFFDLLSDLHNNDDASGAYGKLRIHLNSISGMERMTFRNIF